MVLGIRTIGLPALVSFRTVARLGGISAAAAQLGIAKSGVSRHVAQLEDHLGVRLLERGARSVRLTPVGRRLDDRIRSILAEIDVLGDIVAEERAGVTGQVTIAATPEFGALVAARLFPELRRRHPELSLVMRADYAFEDMQDPGTDLAIRVGRVHDERLVAKPMGGFCRWLVAAPELAEAAPLRRPADLATRPCLTFRGDRPGATWRFERGPEKVAVDVTGPIAVRNFGVLLELARAGQGFGFLPAFMLAEPLARGELVRCLPGWTSPEAPVYLTFRPGSRNIARVAAVLELAEAVLPGLSAA
ncbi:DNA-binding transcriptional regulator, LysR family [Limimaricola pyoseonensis]|uniref:DNA-binding transcriptional regulator, LysR family n=2 Tax=Limimaricola pyoseonensis TaxID=521013 RepID=A0A1G7BV39_9RHOB|nr:DNA-binding transcriptional regulator, LysR family [Limimaricola pyoseonensis]